MSALAAASLAALALVLPAKEPSIETSVEVFKASCLETAGDRGALQTLASARGWRPGQARLHPLMDWADAYEVGSTLLTLAHIPSKEAGNSVTPEQLICALEGVEAPEGWPATISAIEIEGEALGEPSPPPQNYNLPPGLEMSVWFLSDGSRIHGSYVPSQRRLEISINYPPEF